MKAFYTYNGLLTCGNQQINGIGQIQVCATCFICIASDLKPGQILSPLLIGTQKWLKNGQNNEIRLLCLFVTLPGSGKTIPLYLETLPQLDSIWSKVGKTLPQTGKTLSKCIKKLPLRIKRLTPAIKKLSPDFKELPKASKTLTWTGKTVLPFSNSLLWRVESFPCNCRGTMQTGKMFPKRDKTLPQTHNKLIHGFKILPQSFELLPASVKNKSERNKTRMQAGKKLRQNNKKLFRFFKTLPGLGKTLRRLSPTQTSGRQNSLQTHLKRVYSLLKLQGRQKLTDLIYRVCLQGPEKYMALFQRWNKYSVNFGMQETRCVFMGYLDHLIQKDTAKIFTSTSKNHKRARGDLAFHVEAFE